MGVPRETEAGFTRAVVELARALGWRCWHQRPARTARGWRSAGTGDAGCPDLILARGGRVLLVELKAEGGRLGPGQAEWRDAAGGGYRLWRPADWPAVESELRHG